MMVVQSADPDVSSYFLRAFRRGLVHDIGAGDQSFRARNARPGEESFTDGVYDRSNKAIRDGDFNSASDPMRQPMWFIRAHRVGA